MLNNILGCTRRYLSTARPVLEPSSFSSQDNLHKSTTVDANEVSKFKNYVGFWWDELGDMKPLHSMNKLRIPFVRDGLKQRGKLDPEFVNSATPLKNLNILDVGCGGGIVSEPLAKLGANVTGIDACKDLLECAKLHAQENPQIADKIHYIYGNLEDRSDEMQNKYDAIIASEVVEHVASPELFLKTCVKVLKPGGSLFLTTINKTYVSWLAGIIAAEYVFRLVPKGTHEWNKFIAPHEIQKILEMNDCQTRHLHGLFYNLICNQWYWVPNSLVNYALHAVKNE